jgi:hypothetical protein
VVGFGAGVCGGFSRLSQAMNVPAAAASAMDTAAFNRRDHARREATNLVLDSVASCADELAFVTGALQAAGDVQRAERLGSFDLLDDKQDLDAHRSLLSGSRSNARALDPVRASAPARWHASQLVGAAVEPGVILPVRAVPRMKADQIR